METQPATAVVTSAPIPATSTPSAFAAAAPSLNDINMNIRGHMVHIEGLLDYDGLLELEAKLAALKMLLPKPKDAPTASKPN